MNFQKTYLSSTRSHRTCEGRFRNDSCLGEMKLGAVKWRGTY